jgi:tetratricopeptide (TPR) repeat protein
MESSKPDLAVECCIEALKKHPDSMKLLVLHGIALLRSKNFPAALDQFNELARLPHLNWIAEPQLLFLLYYNRACVELKLELVDQGLESLRIAAAIGNVSGAGNDPDFARLRFDPNYQDRFADIMSISVGNRQLGQPFQSVEPATAVPDTTVQTP